MFIYLDYLQNLEELKIFESGGGKYGIFCFEYEYKDIGNYYNYIQKKKYIIIFK